jgi:uncharacterized protein (TIGR00375 family)
VRVIADLHIHGRFSRATSQKLTLTELDKYAKIKGIDIIGTGDFTHPKWLKEITENLLFDRETGTFALKNGQVRFMLTTEVCTVFESAQAIKKVHHVILTPDLELATQINERLAKYGNLTIDGRPTLNMDAATLVEEIISVSENNLIFPAHAWTPWFGIFGAFSGFDCMEDCYEDMTKHVHALETGLSSDPPMNWRLSALDRFALVSNSDSHSFWPWRIGREANVFELKKASYYEITNAIRSKDVNQFKFTIETDPAYGKYHWSGHRNCHVSLSPADAKKLNDFCPVCRRKLTKGVEQRIDELADRPRNYAPTKASGFVRLLPLSEIIAAVLNVSSPSTKQVWDTYTRLISKFGNEYAVLLNADEDSLKSVVNDLLAKAIVQVRQGAIKVVPGYDGIYGQLLLGDNAKIEDKTVKQSNISDFF